MLKQFFQKKTDKLSGSGMSRQSYEEKAAKEAEIWGKLWTDSKRLDILKDDKVAADTLKIKKDNLFIDKFLLQNNIQCEKGLSLACGGGRAEREFLEEGVCKQFDAIDISAKAIQRAKELAKDQNLPINYYCADLNFCELEQDKYDLVITQTCLHHILELEHLAEEICKCLKPNGLLWIHDYIGESRFQYSDKRLNIVNSILAALPKELTLNRLQNKYIEKIIRHDPDKIVSPFEAIRSTEIMPIFLKKFEILEKYENSSILHLVCQAGMRENYVSYKEGHAIFNFLYNLDKKLIDNNVLSPAGGQYILKPK